jgi:hypothetical protein
MENIGQPNLDRSLPCVLCRCSAIGAGGGCCADCMMTVILENQRFKFPISIKELEKKWLKQK